MTDNTSLIDSDPNNKQVLFEEEAKKRSSLVSSVEYHINLTLTQGSSTYENDHTIKFKFDTSKKEGTFLDFIGKSIQKIVLNGEDIISTCLFKGQRIHFTSEMLKEENTLRIKYTNDYNHGGNGFHQFIDPIDKQEYLYTDFEPFEAHRFIPCFDQPNIKAEFFVEIKGPKEWKILTCNPLHATQFDDNTFIHKASKTKPISTYIFAIVAGPYESFEDKVVVRGKEIPLRLFCRKSLTKHLQPDLEEIFTLTKQGFEFYTEFFDFPYPFEKYDQIFVPEYNQGAMENAGCVTFNEQHIFRDTPTESQRLGRADTILHELAHMWFGNLVSPVWWDGLWLNESFATFMAAFTLSKATRFRGELAWQDFNSSMKRWAEREDQQSHTHPIQGSVPDTDATFLNFDGITYGKGAAVLKQLMAVIGEDSFKAGMVYYFKKHQYGNTTEIDFLKALEHGHNSIENKEKVDLIEWSKVWLGTAGLNTIIPKLQIDTQSNRLLSLTVEQQPASQKLSTLRPHTIEIAVFNTSSFINNAPVLSKSFLTNINGESTQIEQLKDSEIPAFIFLNNNDHAYVKTMLDSGSLQFAQENIEKFSSSLLRQLIWGTFHHMLRDAKLPASKFLDIVNKKIHFEKDFKLVLAILRSVEAAIHSFLPEQQFYPESDKFFNLSLDQLNNTISNNGESDAKITWAKTAISSAQSIQNIQKLIDIIDNGGININGNKFEFDQSMRWTILIKAAAFNIPNIEDRITNEEKRDPSDRGQRKAIEARVSVADFANKQKNWDRITTDRESSLYTMTSVMSGFRWRHQRELLRPFEDLYFEKVRNYYKDESKEFARTFSYSLFPFFPEDDKIHKRYEELLSQLNEDEHYCSHFLKEQLDNLRRAKACRDLERQTNSNSN